MAGAKTPKPETERTKSGTHDAPPQTESPALAQIIQTSPDLATLIERWPKLPQHTQQAVLALVRTQATTGGAE